MVVWSGSLRRYREERLSESRTKASSGNVDHLVACPLSALAGVQPRHLTAVDRQSRSPTTTLCGGNLIHSRQFPIIDTEGNAAESNRYLIWKVSLKDDHKLLHFTKGLLSAMTEKMMEEGKPAKKVV